MLTISSCGVTRQVSLLTFRTIFSIFTFIVASTMLLFHRHLLVVISCAKLYTREILQKKALFSNILDIPSFTSELNAH